jgi:hypothetical protein
LFAFSKSEDIFCITWTKLEAMSTRRSTGKIVGVAVGWKVAVGDVVGVAMTVGVGETLGDGESGGVNVGVALGANVPMYTM